MTTVAADGACGHQPFTAPDLEGMERDLSRREVEILGHSADGESNSVIGDALGPLTVKSHLSRIGRRLGAGGRAHLVLLARGAASASAAAHARIRLRAEERG